MAAIVEVWTCPSCGTPLDISALGYYAKIRCPECEHEERVHTLLANFRLEGVLGVGGMSVVLRGRDLLLDRVVAIKLLNDTYKDQDERITRFERECALMARVRHRNVVSIYSAGWENGQFYIAMELVQGENLEELLGDGFCMEQNRAIEIISEVALGLDAASQAGLLHRDMKPGNIILTDQGEAKVLDFGLSLQSTDDDDEEMIWATPFYVPPETLRREPEDVRTDIYSLGMTLRHLLTGSDRFPVEAATAEDLLECKKNLSPIWQENHNLASDLCKLVDHMTAFAPDDRPSDYANLILEIGRTMARVYKKKRISDYLRSRSFAVRAAVSLASMTAGLIIGASLSHSFFDPKPCISEELPAKHVDAARYKDLCAQVEKADWVKAYESCVSIARNAVDDDFSAWASLYAWTICYLNEDLSQNIPEAELLVKEHFSKLKLEGSHILPLHEDLYALQPLVCPEVQLSLPPEAVELTHPMLDAMQLVYLSRLHRLRQDNEQSLELLLQASTLFEYCIAPFDGTANLLAGDSGDEGGNDEEPSISGSDQASVSNQPQATSELDQWERDCTELGFSQLLERTNNFVQTHDLDEASAAKAEAVIEICKAAMAMIDFYESKSPSPSWDDMNQAAIIERAALLSETENRRNFVELKCMTFLLAGKYVVARATNPYTDQKDENKPFAILMRHWLEVLDD